MAPKEKKGITFIESKSIPEYLFHIQNLTESQMENIIGKQFLRLEEIHYRNGWVFPAEAKLLFLVGTDEKDVTKAVTSTGIPIYTKNAAHVKAPEIIEATSAISDHFERKRDVPNVLMELSDVWYNLLHLKQMDADFAPTYQKCIDELCTTMGYSRWQAYKLVILKYRVRLIDNSGGKEHHNEHKEIASQLRSEFGYRLPAPSDTSISDAYRLLNIMSETILRPRLKQLQTLQAWKRNSWHSTRSDWETRMGDPEFPNMYMNKTTILLLQLFRDAVQPKSNNVLQPILVRLDDADMSLSSVFPNTQYITRSLPLADTLAHIGYKTYRQDPLRFKPQEEIDVLWLNANREVLLSSVADGGYVIQSVGDSFVHRHDYSLVGVLTFDRHTRSPLFDTHNPQDYRVRVETDDEFRAVSEQLERDEQEVRDDINEQTAIPLSYAGAYRIRFAEVQKIVHDAMASVPSVLDAYIEMVRLQREAVMGHGGHNNQKAVPIELSLHKLPYKRYGYREAYFVFQRRKNEVHRHSGDWVVR